MFLIFKLFLFLHVYTLIYDLENDNNSKEIDNNYMFEIKKDGQKDLEQILDSKPEMVVWKKIKSIFNNNNQNIKLWCKNPRTGNIYGDYYDEFNQEHKSYFDLVIKFNNGNYLYLEVKGAGEADIDNDKTNKLKKAYQDYFNGNALYSQNLVICIVEVERESIKKISPFYNHGKFDDDLKTFDLEGVVKKAGRLGFVIVNDIITEMLKIL